jgi:hypothetical protein
MKRRTALVSLLVSLMLLMVISTAYAESATDETWTHVPLDYGGLRVEITTPCQVDPGNNITATVKVAAPEVDVEIHQLDVDIFGLENETDEVLLHHIDVRALLDRSNIMQGLAIEVNSTLVIANDTSPGLTYGVVSGLWTCLSAYHDIPAAGFIVTYVRNRELDRLHTEYEELNATYQSLLGNFTELDSEYAVELNGAKNLMYVFVVTTVVAGATVLVLIMRRPKTYW